MLKIFLLQGQCQV